MIDSVSEQVNDGKFVCANVYCSQRVDDIPHVQIRFIFFDFYVLWCSARLSRVKLEIQFVNSTAQHFGLVR